jgi:hypothetical protein
MRIEEFINHDHIQTRKLQSLLDLHDNLLNYDKEFPRLRGSKKELKTYRELKKESEFELDQIRKKMFKLFDAGMRYDEVEDYVFKNFPIDVATEINCSLLCDWHDLYILSKETSSRMNGEE